jgi:quinol monooxygenase YgiN
MPNVYAGYTISHYKNQKNIKKHTEYTSYKAIKQKTKDRVTWTALTKIGVNLDVTEG